MNGYRAAPVPDEPRTNGDVLPFLSRLVAHLRGEGQSVMQAAQRPASVVPMTYLHAEPTRISAGDLVMADGVDWRPDGVNGEGLYRRNSGNSAWLFLG